MGTPPGAAALAGRLSCTGEGVTMGECTWSSVSGAGRSHEVASVVYCGSSGASTAEGSVRLLSTDGAPSLTGDGVVEVFLNNAWSSVCGANSGAASLLCRSLGFTGVASEADSARSTRAPRIGGLSCSGSESSVLDCSFDHGDEVYCAASEASLIHCV